jgi:hypothetical protein
VEGDEFLVKMKEKQSAKDQALGLGKRKGGRDLG